MDQDADKLRRDFEKAGQGHVFERFDDGEARERAELLAQLARIDPDLCSRAAELIATPDSFPAEAEITPLDYVPALPPGGPDARWKAALEAGQTALAAGRVGAFLAAGGQGSRLGFEGPKGTFPVGPVTGRSLFSFYLEALAAYRERTGVSVPLAIMTSPENDGPTREFIASSGYFGMRPGDVSFFPQTMIPSFDSEGRILMESRSRVLLNPGGHGGTFEVLLHRGAGDWFLERGADVIYYFQVDNPLLPVPDPGFIGHHLQEASRFTTKVVRKTGPEERMGVFASVDGRQRVVEYINMTPEMTARQDEKGRLVFWAGNMAVHAIDLAHLKESFGNGVPLPWHVARKTAKVMGPGGGQVETVAHKLETFIFDVIPLLDRAAVVECVREDEFAPVKASDGTDTPERAGKMMTARAARWLEAAGVKVPRDPKGEPLNAIEISPRTALWASDLQGKVGPGLKIDGPTAL